MRCGAERGGIPRAGARGRAAAGTALARIPLRASPRRGAGGSAGRGGGRLPVTDPTGTATCCARSGASPARAAWVGGVGWLWVCDWVGVSPFVFYLFLCRRGWLWVCVPRPPLGVCARGVSAARGALVRGSERSCGWEASGSRGERWVLERGCAGVRVCGRRGVKGSGRWLRGGVSLPGCACVSGVWVPGVMWGAGVCEKRGICVTEGCMCR